MLSGILSVANGVSRINGIALAICGSADPFGDATNFLASLGFGNGSSVTVTGSMQGGAFCMAGVQDAVAAVTTMTDGTTFAAKRLGRRTTVVPAPRAPKGKKTPKRAAASKRVKPKARQKAKARSKNAKKKTAKKTDTKKSANKKR